MMRLRLPASILPVDKKGCLDLLKVNKNCSCFLWLIYKFIIYLEICAVSRHSKKEIGRCFKLILKSLGTQVDTVTTGDFMVSRNTLLD